MKQLQFSTKLKKLDYKTKSRKHYNFCKVLLHDVFARDICSNLLPIENADNERNHN